MFCETHLRFLGVWISFSVVLFCSGLLEVGDPSLRRDDGIGMTGGEWFSFDVVLFCSKMLVVGDPSFVGMTKNAPMKSGRNGSILLILAPIQGLFVEGELTDGGGCCACGGGVAGDGDCYGR
jgi:hypothetical protein